jgi:predicted RNA-binding Zn ribbon-like protein
MRSGADRSARRDHRSLAVDLANTVACPGCRGGDALDSVKDARRWLRAHLPGVKPRVTPADLPPLRVFRSELRRVLAAASARTRPPLAAVSAVNRAAGQNFPQPRLRWTSRDWVSEEVYGQQPIRERVTSLAARDLIDLLGRNEQLPVRQCEGPGCLHFLLARTGRQRWCSPTGCGNRVRVQRHYQKVRFRATSPKTRVVRETVVAAPRRGQRTLSARARGAPQP